MALNLKADKIINENLNYIYPCGLPGGWYSSVEQLFNKEITPLEFSSEFCLHLEDLFVECET